MIEGEIRGEIPPMRVTVPEDGLVDLISDVLGLSWSRS